MRAISARTLTGILVALTAVYLVLIAQRAWSLITSGDLVPIALGVAIAALPVIGVWVIGSEVTFGLRTAELGKALDAAGGLPEDDLPRTPSGRIVREAADARFAERQREVETAPDDWGAWFRLSVAYDDAGDRRRAREAMRTAIEKYQAAST